MTTMPTRRCARPPFDGLLVSKAIVDGLPGATGKYTVAQRQRLYRDGVRSFFRLERADGPRIDTLGDCGGFTYVRDEIPPYTVDEVIDFYDGVRFRPRHLRRPRHPWLRPRAPMTTRAHRKRDGVASPPGAHPGIGQQSSGPGRAPGKFASKPSASHTAGARPRTRSRCKRYSASATPASRSAAWCRSRLRKSWHVCTLSARVRHTRDPVAPARHLSLRER